MAEATVNVAQAMQAVEALEAKSLDAWYEVISWVYDGGSAGHVQAQLDYDLANDTQAGAERLAELGYMASTKLAHIRRCEDQAKVFAQHVFNLEVELAEAFGEQADATKAQARNAAIARANYARGGLRSTITLLRNLGLLGYTQERYQTHYGKGLPLNA